MQPARFARVLVKTRTYRVSQMDAAQFRLPVRIVASGESLIDEIYSAEEALDFVIAWPDRRGRVYDTALKACFAATVDVASADDAQRAFVAFARLNGVLAKDMWQSDRPRRNGGMRPRRHAPAGSSLA